ncbi:hypothetical protein COCMIDRAFT_34506 [Bipolaris oryzae ATCC 44560]|uniref:Cytochrome P450 n=1 Tax=Bipolaris oryzae ATCC 44560 TaxID=930090 RepID=W6ZKE3_COCMI|nr:uncharacterized protein COCMIDRAFT_34506 [Bipolaris oryzae ATCC 44560]EUC47939.1 hypothetical protein COCMIDRAFT_34506 [Bipolaris oryzae ATCC 44560]
MAQLDTMHLSMPQLVGALAALYISYSVARKFYVNAQIKKLGARAPIRKSYLPWNFDLIWETIQSALDDRIYELWTDIFNKECPTGRYTVEFGGSDRLILTAEPENIKAILATQFKDYGKGEQFTKDWYDFLGHGIFTTDGELWHNSRQLIRPQFIKDRLSDIDIFEQHTQLLISKIGNDQETDVLDMMFRYTLDAATHFLLGESVGSLEEPKTEFADAFHNAQRVQSLIARVGPMNWIIPRRYMGFYDSIKKINKFVSTFIDRTLALSQDELEKISKNDEDYTFLHALASYTRDRSTLRDQMVNILLAGRDTTACTLTWAIYHLSVDPVITAKLRQEIINTVGLDNKPTYENLKNMKYLQHVINETLRLYPVVPYNIRMAVKDTTLPVGGGPDGTLPIGIRAGTAIGYSTLVMQRRADLYPPTSASFPPPSAFAPDRWDSWTPKSWTYIPFNGGPRICIGQQFALTEMGYTLVRLLQRFETVENRMGGVEPGMHTDIVLQPAKKVKVVFK